MPPRPALLMREGQVSATPGTAKGAPRWWADVAAPAQTNILSTEIRTKNEAKGNRSQEMAEGGGEKNTHRFSITQFFGRGRLAADSSDRR